MTELGAGNGTGYPAATDTNDTPEVDSPAAGKTLARADVPNDHSAAIIAMQTRSRFKKGADLTSATTLTLGSDGSYFDVTGTTTITGISAIGVGAVISLQFDGALTLTHSATLVLPDSLNITTESTDIATLIQDDATPTWRLLTFSRADATSGGFLTNVVEDTTPQLGGPLDTNSKAINESEGAAVASATTTNIYGGNDGNTLHITGTTTIVDFTDASSVGQWRRIIFDGALTLTHGSGITLPGGANITTAAGDYAYVYADAVDAFTVAPYVRADGSIGTLKHEDGGIEADISAIADGGIVVGTGAGTMAIRASALTGGASGYIKHELGGTEADLSAVADGDVVVGTGAGSMGLESGATFRTTVGLGTGDSPQFTTPYASTSIELGHATDTTLTRSAAGELAVEGTDVKKVGKETIWIPVEALTPATTQPCGDMELIEAGTNDVDYNVMDFDTGSDEYANFRVQFPKSWNESTITFQVAWTSSATDTDGVAWGLQGVALADDETIDSSWGAAVVVTDDNISAAGDMLITSESSAVTIAGSPGVDETVIFRIFRDVSDANDDMAEDARLLGIRMFFTTDASTDT